MIEDENALVDSIVLDDGIRYIIVDKIDINGTTYTLFSNINNEEDICFRKTVTENGKNYYVGLDDENEVNKVILYFGSKLSS